LDNITVILQIPKTLEIIPKMGYYLYAGTNLLTFVNSECDGSPGFGEEPGLATRL
jgi:hypothetical protein